MNNCVHNFVATGIKSHEDVMSKNKKKHPYGRLLCRHEWELFRCDLCGELRACLNTPQRLAYTANQCVGWYGGRVAH